MSAKILNRKNLPRVAKYNLINRFNKDPKTQNFIHNFQNIMIDRLILNRDGEYHPDNVKEILCNKRLTSYCHAGMSVNTDISGGFVLSTIVEADFYILLQEKIKDLTGDYMPMNDFLNLLLTWFYQYYTASKRNKKTAPFIPIKTKKPKNKIELLNNTFSKYYKNI